MGWLGVSLGWSITPCKRGVDGCLNRLVNQPHNWECAPRGGYVLLVWSVTPLAGVRIPRLVIQPWEGGGWIPESEVSRCLIRLVNHLGVGNVSPGREGMGSVVLQGG